MLDALLLVVLAVCALRGFWRGFVRETMGLLALVGAAAGAALWATPLATALDLQRWVAPELEPVAGGALVFVGIYVGVNLVGVGVDRVARALFLGPVIRVMGVVFATAKTAALLGLVLMVGSRMAPGFFTDERLEASHLAAPLVEIANGLVEIGSQWVTETGVRGL